MCTISHSESGVCQVVFAKSIKAHADGGMTITGLYCEQLETPFIKRSRFDTLKIAGEIAGITITATTMQNHLGKSVETMIRQKDGREF